MEEEAATEQMDAEDDADDAPPPSSTKSPAEDPSKWSVPVLQSKLKTKLGQKAKLPKKKDELLRMYHENYA